MAAGSFVTDWYNSAARSAEMRKERYKQQEKLKGTFVDNAQLALDKILARGQEDRKTGALADKAAGERTSDTNRTRLAQQGLANAPKLAEIKAKTPYWNSSAALNNSQTRVQGLTADKMEQTLPLEVAAARIGADEKRNIYEENWREPTNTAEPDNPVFSDVQLSRVLAQAEQEDAIRKRKDLERRRNMFTPTSLVAP